MATEPTGPIPLADLLDAVLGELDARATPAESRPSVHETPGSSDEIEGRLDPPAPRQTA